MARSRRVTACDDIHIPADPMARVKLRFEGDGKKPVDFTGEDRCLILTLARESGTPAIYARCQIKLSGSRHEP
jgi:hypothetical protein